MRLFVHCAKRTPPSGLRPSSPASGRRGNFLCREVALIIEVDGATHSEDRDIACDQRRTAYLESPGFRVLRVLNHDIYHHFDDVMDMILLALADKLPQD
ncbi:MAG: DUF559 domain-containing protein [Alphaproteobacteria bacterium]|nr:MAG: DUF559 domain-containing protein [Alphaproteobacteria bacterium]